MWLSHKRRNHDASIQATCFAEPHLQPPTEYTLQDELDDQQREMEVEEMPGGCKLDTEERSGGAGTRDVGKGKQRMVTCQEVEDEDMVGRGKMDSTGEEEHKEEDEFYSFSEDEDEDVEGEEDDSEEEDESEDENELEHKSYLLWTCDICNTTLNIFARDQHLRSRLHLRNTGGKTHAAYDDPAPPYTWRCTFCAEDMSVFHRADHLASKPHLKAVLQHGPLSAPPTPEELADLPTLARSSSFDLRETFYCITCAAEFGSSEQAEHLATSAIWDCDLCATRLHPAASAGHLDSEAHAVAKRRSKAPEEDLVCNVCDCVYTLAEKDDHLAGTEHRTALARNQLEQMYLEQKRQAKSAGPSIHEIPAVSNPPPKQKGQKVPAPPPPSQSYCEVCNKYIGPGGMSGHMNGKKHKKKEVAKKDSEKRQAEIFRLPIREIPSETNPPPPKKKKKPTPSPALSSPHCEICDKYIGPATTMASHRLGKKHRKQEAAKKTSKPSSNMTPRGQASNWELASAQHIIISGRKFHCAVCNRDRSVVGMEGHVNGITHLRKMAAARVH